MILHEVKRKGIHITFKYGIPSGPMIATIGDDVIKVSQEDDGFTKKMEPIRLHWQDYNMIMGRKLKEHHPEIEIDMMDFRIWDEGRVKEEFIPRFEKYIVKPDQLELFREEADI